MLWFLSISISFVQISTSVLTIMAAVISCVKILLVHIVVAVNQDSTKGINLARTGKHVKVRKDLFSNSLVIHEQNTKEII